MSELECSNLLQYKDNFSEKERRLRNNFALAWMKWLRDTLTQDYTAAARQP